MDTWVGAVLTRDGPFSFALGGVGAQLTFFPQLLLDLCSNLLPRSRPGPFHLTPLPVILLSMDMTYATLADFAKTRRSWRSTGAAFDTNVRTCASLALQGLSAYIQGALVNTTWHTSLMRSVDCNNTYTAARLAATADYMVLEFTKVNGALLDNADWHPTVDGTWDALMWLEIEIVVTNPDGTTRTTYERRQTLEWWTATDNDGVHWYVTIDRPWRNTTDTTLVFRIIQPWFFMPSAYQGAYHPKAGRVIDTGSYNVTELSFSDADTTIYEPYPSSSSGIPHTIWRDKTYIEQAFSTAPTAASFNSAWLGPVQEGAFKFYATVVWGRTGQSWQDAPNRIRDPIFESAPSPVSAEFTHTATPGLAIRITVPNPDQMRGFSVSSTLRYKRSGRRVRIYVARTGLRTAGLGTYNNVEADGVPYLLDEIEAYDASPASTYTWTGSVIPEYTRRLPFHSTTQVGYRVYPLADSEYQLDLRCKCAPPELAAPGDVVPVHELATEMFLLLFEAQLCRIDGGDLASAAILERQGADMAGFVRGQLQGTQVVNPTSFRIQRGRKGPRVPFPVSTST